MDVTACKRPPSFALTPHRAASVDMSHLSYPLEVVPPTAVRKRPPTPRPPPRPLPWPVPGVPVLYLAASPALLLFVYLLQPHGPSSSSHADKFILALGHFCDGSLPLTACLLMSCLWANVISEEKTSLTTLSQMAAPPLPFPPPCHLSLFSCIALSFPDIVIKYASFLCCQLHVSGPVRKLHDAKVQPCFV